MSDQFILWAFGDAHIATDMRRNRNSMKEAIEQIEYGNNDCPAVDWDIAINVGDMSGSQGLPDDEEGQMVADSYLYLKKHNREDIYDICGNHDRSGLNEPKNWWFQKWIDPIGKNTQYSGVNPLKRKYNISGTWERYSFCVGNLLFLMMSDINEPSQKKGRGDFGGNPGGVVSMETFQWWKDNVEKNQDKIIISAHHYMLKDTTVASGEYEGLQKDNKGNYKTYYHGYYPQSTPKGTSYLYWTGGISDAMLFENYLNEHPGAISLWLGGHTHTRPDDTTGGKTHIENKWGTTFINVAALSKHHAFLTTYPMSRVLYFTEGCSNVLVRCLDHDNEKRFLDKYDKVIDLGKKFYRL